MKIENGKIVRATRLELYEYWLISGWSDVMSFPDYRYKVQELGTEVVEDDDD